MKNIIITQHERKLMRNRHICEDFQTLYQQCKDYDEAMDALCDRYYLSPRTISRILKKPDTEKKPKPKNPNQLSIFSQ